MTRDDVLQFARRDRSAVAESKTRFWHDLKSHRTAAEVMAIADQLRRQARQLRPDWPTVEARVDDLAVHQRVAEALRSVAPRPR